MIHARDDYNRIQDPAGKIPDDEPVFLLRAQDQLACFAVKYYAEMCKHNQAPEIAAKAMAHAERMAAWPVKKIPDLPLHQEEVSGATPPPAQPSQAEQSDCALLDELVMSWATGAPETQAVRGRRIAARTALEARLATQPPREPVQPLSDEDIDRLCNSTTSTTDLARAVIAEFCKINSIAERMSTGETK